MATAPSCAEPAKHLVSARKMSAYLDRFQTDLTVYRDLESGGRPG